MDLKYQIQLLENQVVGLESQNDALSQKLRAAQHEVEAMAATVEALRSAIMSNCYDDPSTSGKRLMELANSTPQQHLAELRADAGRAGFIEGYDSCWFQNYGTRAPEHAATYSAEQHAESVRAGEK